jgi:glycosyltransferase involved in cell wall biosynthesis
MTVRVAHLTSAHPQDDVRIFVKECRSLAAAGYDVYVVAPGESRPDVDGVHFAPVPRPRNRLDRAIRVAWDIYRTSRRLHPSVYHFHDPELIPIGLLLKLRGGCVVYDVHEDVPRQILRKDWIQPWLRRPVAFGAGVAERVASHVLDAIVAVVPPIATRFPSDKTVLVRNYPIIDDASGRSDAVPYASRPATVVYAGSITASRGVRQMVAAMAEVAPTHDPRLMLAGQTYPTKLDSELAAMPGWERTTLLGWLGRDAVSALLDDARIGIVTFLPEENNRNSYPTKLFEYMAAGLPLIASDFPLWRDIVGTADCGILVDPTDPRAIAAAIDWLLNHPVEAEAMGRRGQHAAMTKYRWATEQEVLLVLYERLIAGKDHGA